MSQPPRDRFDDVAHRPGRVGAHRAENPRMNGWVTVLWAATATLILVIAGTFATMVVTGRITLFPEAPPAATTEPEDPGVIDTDYLVLILNGTPDTGLDARFRDLVVNEGWSGANVFAGPSGTSSFRITTIYFSTDADEAAARGLARVIGGAALEKDDYYANSDDPESKQLTIVIGLDRSTVLPESDED